MHARLSTILSAAALPLAATLTGSRAPCPVRIMPLGDSITGSPGCWRAMLWRRLQEASIRNTKFVGSLPGQWCGFAYDGDNEGHAGIQATGIVADGLLPGWLRSAQPDVVMMHLGTNDIMTAKTTVEILDAYGIMVDWMRESRAAMRILVARIIPLKPFGCAECYRRVVDLNEAIPAWAASMNSTESPITVVDCWTGFDVGEDTWDGIHPVDSGNEKLANCWYHPLVRYIQDVEAGPDRCNNYQQAAEEGRLDQVPL